MAVRIRVSRIGKRNRPYWRVVAVDSRKKRDGACLENLGTYDPINHKIVQLNLEKIKEWIAKGAICSDAVAKLLKQSRSSKTTVS